MAKKKYELPKDRSDAIAAAKKNFDDVSLPDSSKRADSMSAIDKALAAPEYGPAFSSTVATSGDVEFGPAMSSTVPTAGGVAFGPAGDYVQGSPLTEAEYKELVQTALAQANSDAAAEESQWSKILGPQGARAASSLTRAFRSGRIRGQGQANRVKSFLGSVPIPGGIGVPLIIFLVLWFTLVTVNGHTRAAWLWLVLTGKANINPKAVTGGPTLNNATLQAIGSGLFPFNTQGNANASGLSQFLPNQNPPAPVNPAPSPFGGNSGSGSTGNGTGPSSGITSQQTKNPDGSITTVYSNGTWTIDCSGGGGATGTGMPPNYWTVCYPANPSPGTHPNLTTVNNSYVDMLLRGSEPS